jgi:hypothetical protein
MGVLTIDMRRLRGEIDAAHGMRETLMQNLARSTRELKRGVNAMLTASHASHLQTARRTHADCSAFVAGVEKAVNHIRSTVASLKKDFASDLQGARRAWRGGDVARRGKAATRHGAGGRGKRT